MKGWGRGYLERRGFGGGGLGGERRPRRGRAPGKEEARNLGEGLGEVGLDGGGAWSGGGA